MTQFDMFGMWYLSLLGIAQCHIHGIHQYHPPRGIAILILGFKICCPKYPHRIWLMPHSTTHSPSPFSPSVTVAVRQCLPSVISVLPRVSVSNLLLRQHPPMSSQPSLVILSSSSSLAIPSPTFFFGIFLLLSSSLAIFVISVRSAFKPYLASMTMCRAGRRHSSL